MKAIFADGDFAVTIMSQSILYNFLSSFLAKLYDYI